MRRFALALASLCLVVASSAAAVDVGGRAPEIGLSDLAGHRVTVASLRGQVFVVDLWGTYCHPCEQELPLLQSLYDELHAQGFTVIAVASDPERATVERFVRRLHLTFPIVHDASHAIPTRYAAHAQPASYVVDRRGIVRHVHGGYRASDADTIRREIRALVAQPRR